MSDETRTVTERIADYLRANAADIEDTLAHHPEQAELFAKDIVALAALPTSTEGQPLTGEVIVAYRIVTGSGDDIPPSGWTIAGLASLSPSPTEDPA